MFLLPSLRSGHFQADLGDQLGIGPLDFCPSVLSQHFARVDADEGDGRLLQDLGAGVVGQDEQADAVVERQLPDEQF